MQEQTRYLSSSPFDSGPASAGFGAFGDGPQPFLDGFARELLQSQESLSLNGDLFAGLPQPTFPASPHPPVGDGLFGYTQASCRNAFPTHFIALHACTADKAKSSDRAAPCLIHSTPPNDRFFGLLARLGSSQRSRRSLSITFNLGTDRVYIAAQYHRMLCAAASWRQSVQDRPPSIRGTRRPKATLPFPAAQRRRRGRAGSAHK